MLSKVMVSPIYQEVSACGELLEARLIRYSRLETHFYKIKLYLKEFDYAGCGKLI